MSREMEYTKCVAVLCKLYCHSANYLEAFLSVYLETNSGSNSVMGILNYCCPAKSAPPAKPVVCFPPYKGSFPALESKDSSKGSPAATSVTY